MEDQRPNEIARLQDELRSVIRQWMELDGFAAQTIIKVVAEETQSQLGEWTKAS